MKWVDKKIKEEQNRANRYLEPHSLSKVISAVVHTLIDQYKDFLAEQFIPLIQSNDIELLNLMFSLLDRVEGGIEPILQKFEDFLVNIGIQNLKMEALSIVQDSEKYIEQLLALFNLATELVNNAFSGDPRFLTARDMVRIGLTVRSEFNLFFVGIQHSHQRQERLSICILTQRRTNHFWSRQY